MKTITVSFTISPKILRYAGMISSHALAAWLGYYYVFVHYSCTPLA